ncbi:unnamed protein product [Effrenium voratum]|nr:unnamed protein product [Effrenium voratum]
MGRTVPPAGSGKGSERGGSPPKSQSRQPEQVKRRGLTVTAAVIRADADAKFHFHATALLAQLLQLKIQQAFEMPVAFLSQPSMLGFVQILSILSPCLAVVEQTLSSASVSANGKIYIAHEAIPDQQTLTAESDDASLIRRSEEKPLHQHNGRFPTFQLAQLAGREALRKEPEIKQFTSTDAWTPEADGTAEILIVGGGGGGGGRSGGGGGGGAVVEVKDFKITKGTKYEIVVGEGGKGGTPAGAPGSSGQKSQFGDLTALGGGGGGSDGAQEGKQGGSGGGGKYGKKGGPAIQSKESGDSGKNGHGHAGGSGTSGTWNAGGGGGAGSKGMSGTASECGNGGKGYESKITGKGEYYGGGGGGGSHNPPCKATAKGGEGGGGDGGKPGGKNAGAGGKDEYGGGGGGGSTDSGTGGAGGKGGAGIVVVKFTAVEAEKSTATALHVGLAVLLPLLPLLM